MMRKFGISSMVVAALLTLAAYAGTAPTPEYKPVPAPGNHDETLDVGTGANKRFGADKEAGYGYPYRRREYCLCSYLKNGAGLP